MGHPKRSRRLHEAERFPAEPQSRKRWRLLTPAAPVAFALSLAFVIAALFLVSLTLGDSPADGPKTAAIVDQLTLTVPNPDFVQSATDTLEQAGYSVDYFPGKQVTLDFYRQLPTHGYDLVVLRVHSAHFRDVWHGRSFDEAMLFTSEPYSPDAYLDEQKAGRLAQVQYHEGGELYFGIGADFVRSSMRGQFEDTTIIMMGCSGLNTTTTGEAFLRRGAGAFVSWNDFVSGPHTDEATELLLEHLVLEGFNPVDAVALTRQDVGPDPSTNAELRVLSAEG